MGFLGSVLSLMQVALRIANEKYIREHPELQKMMSACVDHVLVTRPDDVLSTVRDFFKGDAVTRALTASSR